MPAATTSQYDHFKIFRQGADFDYSTTILDIHTKLLVDAAPQAPIIKCDPPTLVSGIISTIFSCELYLKCLLAIQIGGAPPKGHNLKPLFEQLARPKRDRIKQLYNQVMKNTFQLPNVSQAIREAFQKQQDFDFVMNSADSSYNKWRYSYEEINFPGSNPVGIKVALRMTILELDEKCKAYWEGVSEKL